MKISIKIINFNTMDVIFNSSSIGINYNNAFIIDTTTTLTAMTITAKPADEKGKNNDLLLHWCHITNIFYNTSHIVNNMEKTYLKYNLEIL